MLLPAFGLAYAVGVARVLGPRVVLRRSLQYALARRTLAALVAVLPAMALVISLVRDRSRTLGEIVDEQRRRCTSALIAVLGGGAPLPRSGAPMARPAVLPRGVRRRKILLSLASRVRFETDPADLAAMVVGQIDEALHPEMVAILVSGLEEGRLVPVTVLHGSADSLPARRRPRRHAALVGRAARHLAERPALARSAACRRRSRNGCTAPARRCWCRWSAQDKSLVAVIVLGERRSEEAYTDEDRQLLGSIAAQMGLGFDVARLRRRAAHAADLEKRDDAAGGAGRRRR